MDLTIITVLKSGQHLTYSKVLPGVRLLFESDGRRITLARPSGRLHRDPQDSAVRRDPVSQLADHLALDHMAERRREYDVEKFILIRGNFVMELDADDMSVPTRVA